MKSGGVGGGNEGNAITPRQLGSLTPNVFATSNVYVPLCLLETVFLTGELNIHCN